MHGKKGGEDYICRAYDTILSIKAAGGQGNHIRLAWWCSVKNLADDIYWLRASSNNSTDYVPLWAAESDLITMSLLAWWYLSWWLQELKRDVALYSSDQHCTGSYRDRILIPQNHSKMYQVSMFTNKKTAGLCQNSCNTLSRSKAKLQTKQNTKNTHLNKTTNAIVIQKKLVISKLDMKNNCSQTKLCDFTC